MFLFCKFPMAHIDKFQENNKYDIIVNDVDLVDKADYTNMLYFNIRSLRNKIVDVDTFSNNISTNIGLIALTETWLNVFENQSMQISGFTGFHSNRTNANYGGCSLFVKNNLSCTVLHEEDFENNNFLVVKIHNYNITIIVVYKQPSSNTINFINKFESIISNYRRNLIVGDFNMNLLNDDSDTNKFVQMLTCNGHGILNKIDSAFATRVSDTVSIIDLVIVNDFKIKYEFYLGDTSLSDHRYILFRFFSVKDRLNDNVLLYKEVVDYDSIEKSGLLRNLDSLQNFNDLIMKISSLIRNNTKQIPIKQNRIGNLPWINKEILYTMKQRERFYRYKRKYPSDEYICSQYLFYVNKVKILIYTSRNNYYSTLFNNCLTKPKELWRNLSKMIFGRASKNSAINLKVDGILTENKQEIAKLFNEHFTNSITEITTKLPPPDETFFQGTPYEIIYQFQLPSVTATYIKDIILSLKRNCSNGYDKISTRFIQKYAIEFSPCISRLINNSTKSFSYPNPLKISKTIPIPKDGCALSIMNYRPVSVMTIFTKIFDKVLNIALIEFLNNNDIISSKQFGFCQQSNTLAACLNLTNLLAKSRENKRYTIALFLDLKKAFDTVNHKILIWKLKQLKFGQGEINFFKSYLEHRQQYVDIDGVKSKYSKLSTGVVQGSVMGPTLFKIFINDLFLLNTHGIMQMFADDIVLIYEGDDLCTTINLMQNDLDSFYLWFSKNSLILNAEKSKYIIFGEGKSTEQLVKVNYDGRVLEKVSSYLYLGLQIDDKLKWNLHVNRVKSKILPYVFALNRTKTFLPKSVLKLLYNSYVISQITYLNSIWSNAPQYKLNELFLIQKRAVKSILNVPIRTPTNSIFQEFLPLELIVKKELLLVAFKIINNLIKHNSAITQISETHTHFTRRQSRYRVSTSSNFVSKLNVIYRSFQLFNELPTEIRHEVRLIVFKYKILEFLKNPNNILNS